MPVFNEDDNNLTLEQKIMVVLTDLESLPEAIKQLNSRIETSLKEVRETGKIAEPTEEDIQSDFFNLIEDLKYMGAVFGADVD